MSPLRFAMHVGDFECFLATKYDGLYTLSDEMLHCLDENGIAVSLKLYEMLYADDTVLMAEIEYELQLALEAAHDYCKA